MNLEIDLINLAAIIIAFSFGYYKIRKSIEDSIKQANKEQDERIDIKLSQMLKQIEKYIYDLDERQRNGYKKNKERFEKMSSRLFDIKKKYKEEEDVKSASIFFK